MADVSTYSEVIAVLRRKQREFIEAKLVVDVLLHYAENQGGGTLPERMSEDEALKFIAERCQQTATGTLKLRGVV